MSFRKNFKFKTNLKKLFHFVPIILGSDFHLSDLLSTALWLLPFAGVYIWHLYHDHRHNDKMIKKLDEIIELLKKKR